NLTGAIPGVPAFATAGVPLNAPFVPTTPFGIPVPGIPTMTPFGVVPQPTMAPFIGQTPFGVVPQPTRAPFIGQTPFGPIPAINAVNPIFGGIPIMTPNVNPIPYGFNTPFGIPAGYCPTTNPYQAIGGIPNPFGITSPVGIPNPFGVTAPVGIPNPFGVASPVGIPQISVPGLNPFTQTVNPFANPFFRNLGSVLLGDPTGGICGATHPNVLNTIPTIQQTPFLSGSPIPQAIGVGPYGGIQAFNGATIQPNIATLTPTTTGIPSFLPTGLNPAFSPFGHPIAPLSPFATQIGGVPTPWLNSTGALCTDPFLGHILNGGVTPNWLNNGFGANAWPPVNVTSPFGMQPVTGLPFTATPGLFNGLGAAPIPTGVINPVGVNPFGPCGYPGGAFGYGLNNTMYGGIGLNPMLSTNAACCGIT
ncbi:MAG: hypothetical protein V3T70_05160, partial [Phycisphaerae bacterium]